jgi:hypothetical protein
VAACGRKSDVALAAALAAGKTVADAAAAAHVSERTAYRRLADPGFRCRVTELRAGMVERALGRTADGMASAARTLRRLLRSDSDSVRLGAARALLELGVKLRETVDLEQRLAALEAAAQQTGGPRE